MAMVIANQPLDAAIENAKKVYGALKANPRSLYLGRTFTVTLNSQEQAKFTDLLIDLGVLIFQSQKMPEQGKIKVLTGMVQLIASKVEPDRTEQFEKSMHLALKAVPFVWQLAECEKSQQIQQIQNVVMNLVLTKEWFSFNKYYSSLHNELIRCEEIRKKFWTLLPQSLGRKNFWALSKDSPLTEICRNSRHVFILFVKYGNYLKQGLRSQDPNYSQFTEPLEKRLSHCDPSERMVIEVFLAQFKASKAAEAYNRIQGKWKGFFTNTMKHLIEDQFFRTMIPEFAPEFKSGVIKVNTYLKSYNDAFAEDKEVLDVNAGITALLTQECSLFSQVIDEKNFIYSFFLRNL